MSTTIGTVFGAGSFERSFDDHLERLVLELSDQTGGELDGKVAIAEVITEAGSTTVDGSFITNQIFSTVASSSWDVQLVERRELERAIEESQFNRNLTFRDASDVVAVGDFLPAAYLMVAETKAFEEFTNLTARLFSTADGSVIAVSSVDISNDDPKISTRHATAKKSSDATPRFAPASRGSTVEHNSIEGVIGLGYTAIADYVSGMLSVAYVHAMNPSFAVGGWIGAGADLFDSQTVWTTVFGARFVFGDRRDGIAGSLNLGIPPSIGLYYKGFLFNMIFLVLEGSPTIWTEIGSSLFL